MQPTIHDAKQALNPFAQAQQARLIATYQSDLTSLNDANTTATELLAILIRARDANKTFGRLGKCDHWLLVGFFIATISTITFRCLQYYFSNQASGSVDTLLANNCSIYQQISTGQYFCPQKIENTTCSNEDCSQLESYNAAVGGSIICLGIAAGMLALQALMLMVSVPFCRLKLGCMPPDNIFLIDHRENILPLEQVNGLLGQLQEQGDNAYKANHFTQESRIGAVIASAQELQGRLTTKISEIEAILQAIRSVGSSPVDNKKEVPPAVPTIAAFEVEEPRASMTGMFGGVQARHVVVNVSGAGTRQPLPALGVVADIPGSGAKQPLLCTRQKMLTI